MATTLYASFFPHVAPHLPGMPDAVLERYISKVAIDLCTRAKIWRADMTPISLVAGQQRYTPVSSVANTELDSPLHATILRGYTPWVVSTVYSAGAQISNALHSYQNIGASGTAATAPVHTFGSVSDGAITWTYIGDVIKDDLDIFTNDYVNGKYPLYPDPNDPRIPEGIYRDDAATLNIVPLPDSSWAYTVNVFAAIRPTDAATGWEGTLQTEYRRALFHGVLHECMMMSKRPWSDLKLAEFHGKQWEFFVQAARARANKGFGRGSVSVTQNAWA